jgi:hypothetical protein
MAAHTSLSDFVKEGGYYDLHSKRYESLNKMYGSRDIHSIFGNLGQDPNFEKINEHMIKRLGALPPDREQYRFMTAQTAPVPWDRAARSKESPVYDAELVSRTVQKARNEDIQEFDPRMLTANQPAVTSSGVRHYLNNESGLYADKGDAGNQIPFVYVKKETGQGIILAGHHRAAAALLRGKPLRARGVIGE